MGRALGLCAARGEPFGGGLSGAAREQPATVGVGPARTVGGVLWGSRGTRTANGRGIRPLGSGTRLEPSSADRPHLGWAYVVLAVWLPTPRRAYSVGCGVENGNKRARICVPSRRRLGSRARTSQSLQWCFVGGTEYLTVLEVCYERISVEPFREAPEAEASAKPPSRTLDPPGGCGGSVERANMRISPQTVWR